jgi:hypothetical protein
MLLCSGGCRQAAPVLVWLVVPLGEQGRVFSNDDSYVRRQRGHYHRLVPWHHSLWAYLCTPVFVVVIAIIGGRWAGGVLVFFSLLVLCMAFVTGRWRLLHKAVMIGDWWPAALRSMQVQERTRPTPTAILKKV